MKNNRKINDFRSISGHFFEDGYRHHFSSILGRFGFRFGMHFGFKIGKWIQKNTAKTYLQKNQSGNPGKSAPGSYGPFKQFKDSQIRRLVNLTQGLETLHWCLAARWRIILLHFGLVTFDFHFAKTQQVNMFMIFGPIGHDAVSYTHLTLPTILRV